LPESRLAAQVSPGSWIWPIGSPPWLYPPLGSSACVRGWSRVKARTIVGVPFARHAGRHAWVAGLHAEEARPRRRRLLQDGSARPGSQLRCHLPQSPAIRLTYRAPAWGCLLPQSKSSHHSRSRRGPHRDEPGDSPSSAGAAMDSHSRSSNSVARAPATSALFT
jgi:hypothetical protein